MSWSGMSMVICIWFSRWIDSFLYSLWVQVVQVVFLCFIIGCVYSVVVDCGGVRG